MKKVSTFEALVGNLECLSLTPEVSDTPLGLFLKIKGLECHPFESLSTGKIGLAFFDLENPNEHANEIPDNSFCWLCDLFEPPIEKLCNSFKQFKQLFENCAAKDFYIVRLDDVASLKLGFLCFNKQGPIWYKMDHRKFLKGYKLYQQTIEWKKQLDDMEEIDKKEKTLGYEE